MAARRRDNLRPLPNDKSALPIRIPKGRDGKTTRRSVKEAKAKRMAELFRMEVVHHEGVTSQDYAWLDDPDFKGVAMKALTKADIDKMIERLSPRQVTYAVARLWGFTTLTAAKQVSADAATTRRWEKTPWWSTLVQRERDRAFGQKNVALDPLVPMAVGRLRAALTGEYGPDHAVDVAKYVFDHRHGRASQHTTVEGDAPQAGLAQAFVDLVRGAAEANRALAEQHRALNPPQEVEVIEPTEEDDHDYGSDGR